MLKRVFTPQESRKFSVTAGETEGLSLFEHRLEFNPPAHGVWNIVHVGMLVPEAHQIYVCAINCMRGVVLTAAEMGMSDRFSMVLLEDADILQGRVEDVTIEGVTETLNNLPELPPVVMVFTVCTHRFIGCNYNHIYKTLSERFPEVTFLRCFMEPITQKEGLSPDQRLRKTIFDPLEALPVINKTVAVLGSDLKLDDNSDIKVMLQKGGYKLKEIQDCGTYEEYLDLGSAELFIAVFPRALYGAQITARRLGRKCFYMPSTFSYDEIEALESSLAAELDLPLPDFENERKGCESALERAKNIAGDFGIAIDFSVHPRPLSLARMLIEHGFDVRRVYLNAVDPPEKDDLDWLRINAPDLMFCSCLAPERRVVERGEDEKMLAVGQIAAWAEDTLHFVNMVEGGGLWGFDGIRSMAELICDAALTEKDTQDLVPRKGWGCESCF